MTAALPLPDRLVTPTGEKALSLRESQAVGIRLAGELLSLDRLPLGARRALEIETNLAVRLS